MVPFPDLWEISKKRPKDAQKTPNAYLENASSSSNGFYRFFKYKVRKYVPCQYEKVAE